MNVCEREGDRIAITNRTLRIPTHSEKIISDIFKSNDDQVCLAKEIRPLRLHRQTKSIHRVYFLKQIVCSMSPALPISKTPTYRAAIAKLPKPEIST